MRDLTRAREDAKKDLLAARHRLSKFLLRHGLYAPEKVKPWGAAHRRWLDGLHFENKALQVTFQEYLHAIDEITERVKRLEAEIHEQASNSVHAPVIQALETLRGVAEVTAVTLVAEIGEFSRFSNPRQLMAFAGVTPREHSSGGTTRKGGITKAGNAHVRRVLLEAAWSYRYAPALKGGLRRRQEGQNPQLQAIAWKAQNRLHRKYHRLVLRGKSPAVAATAVARELLGFVWAIACKVEETRRTMAA